jgi:carboxymethylenebutenolidase
VIAFETGIPAVDGLMQTFLAHPDRGPSPVVLIYMDGPGIRQDLHDVARRLASAGYYAMLPDLYYRYGERGRVDVQKIEAQDPAEFRHLMSLVQALQDSQVLADTQVLLDYADSDPAATTPRGCLGFCMGARFVLRAMSSMPAAFAAGSGFHPSFVVTDAPDSPHLGVGQVRGELYFGFGAADRITPVNTAEPLRQELERHGVRAQVEILPEADHGYAFPHMAAYRPEAAEVAWRRTLDLFGRHLQRAPTGVG